MNASELSDRIRARMDEIRTLQQRDVPDIVGTEAVDHYKENFVKEGFTDKTTTKWKDVKRRDPESPWYGFSPEGAKHFSPTRAADKILTGDTAELQNSITYTKHDNVVTVGTDKPYAAVHQFGLPAKIFGKKPFQMPARPFVGRSVLLEQNIYNKIKSELKKIIDK